MFHTKILFNQQHNLSASGHKLFLLQGWLSKSINIGSINRSLSLEAEIKVQSITLPPPCLTYSIILNNSLSEMLCKFLQDVEGSTYSKASTFVLVVHNIFQYVFRMKNIFLFFETIWHFYFFQWEAFVLSVVIFDIERSHGCQVFTFFYSSIVKSDLWGTRGL